MMRVLSSVAALFVLGLSASTAVATDYSGSRLRLEYDPNILPEAGQIFEATFVLEVGQTSQLVGATFDSGRSGGTSHWEPIGMNLPVEQTVEPESPLRYDFQMICNDPTQPLWFDYNVDGVQRRKYFRLMPTAPGVLLPANPARAIAAWSGGAVVEEAAPASPPEQALKDRMGGSPSEAFSTDDEGMSTADPEAVRATVRTISGQLLMDVRDIGPLLPVNGATLVFYDEDSGVDDYIGITITKPDGSFDFTFLWTQSELPDVYIVVLARNSVVDVVEPTLTEPTYEWVTQTRFNLAQNYNWGPIEPNLDNSPLHTLSCITQMYGWLNDNGYGNLEPIDVLTPDSDWPHYSDEEIFMSDDRRWEAGTIWHEYGHHVMYRYALFPSSDGYCNPGQRADYIDGDTNCRHAGWCKEDGDVAWAEGFPNWMADRMTRLFWFRYGVDPVDGLNLETHGKCSPDNNGPDPADYDDPALTENAFAGLVRDLEDGVPDMDGRALGPGGVQIGIDEINMTDKDILDTAFGTVSPISSPLQFLDVFQTATFTGSPYEMWATAYNNGINLDGEKPGTVTNLQSPTHPTPAPSTAAEIRFTWDFASDNMSGVAGYSVFISDAITPPDFTMDIGDVENLWTDPMPPGTYWFTIRAMDKVGHWSDDYETIGPIIVKEPDPANLEPLASANYSYPAVPRTSQLLLTGVALTPTTLGGSPGQFYMNLSVYNSGMLPTTATSGIYTYIDGELEWTSAILASAPLAPGAFAHFENLGPTSVEGGRHTITMVVDANQALAEPDETDNRDVRQWVFSPLNLPVGVPYSRSAPPKPYAGFAIGEQTSMTAPNCKGVRLNATGQVYSGVSLIPATLQDDYDLRSHPKSINPLTGFDPAFPSGAWEMAVSMRPEGFSDFILVHPGEAGSNEWDFAVLNANPSPRVDPRPEDDFELRRVDSVGLALNSPLHTGLGLGDVLALYHFTMPERTNGTRVVTLDAGPGTETLYLAVYPVDEPHLGQGDFTGFDDIDVMGDARVGFVATPGDYAIAVWREPIEAPQLPATPFTIEVRAPLPDLATSTDPGWAGPLVPRAAADGAPGSVPAPTELFGDQPLTWLNTLVRNRGTVDATAFGASIELDGVEIETFSWPGLNSLTPVTDHAAAPIVVRGGRHTLALRVDDPDDVEEEDEANNLHGRQWIFTPTILPVGSMVVRAAPPERSGGYLAVEAAKEVDWEYPNCDGLRMPLPSPSGNNGHWLGFFAAPADTSDVNLNLHQVATSPTAGFADPVVSSFEEAGAIEYVLTNFRAQGSRHYDVGVTKISGEDDYQAWTVQSSWLGSDPMGSQGTFTLADGMPGALHEVQLSAGPLYLELAPAAAGVEWGLALHRTKILTHSRRSALAVSAGGEAGAHEQLVVDVPEPGTYCVAVYRRNSRDLAGAADYSLVFNAPTGSPAASRSGDRLVGAYPNPFNPRTTIRYELAEPGRVTVRIFDLRGRAVRTLVDDFLSAGPHDALWNGLDGSGRPVSSGVYLVRFDSGRVQQATKVVLVE